MPEPAPDPPWNTGDTLVVVGGLLVAAGAGLWSVPLGLVVLGAELLVAGLWWLR